MKKQEATAAVIDTLAEKWPNAFFADPQKRRPLKVGGGPAGRQQEDAIGGPAVLYPTPLLRAGGRQGPGPRRPERRRGRAGERAGQGMAAAELRKGAPKQEREAEARRAADEKYRPTGVNAEKPKLSLRKVTP